MDQSFFSQSVQKQIIQIFYNLRKQIQDRPLHVLFEPKLNCNTLTDHEKPKNILPIYQSMINSAEIELLKYMQDSISNFNISFPVQNNQNTLIQKCNMQESIITSYELQLQQILSLSKFPVKNYTQIIQNLREQLNQRNNNNMLYKPDDGIANVDQTDNLYSQYLSSLKTQEQLYEDVRQLEIQLQQQGKQIILQQDNQIQTEQVIDNEDSALEVTKVKDTIAKQKKHQHNDKKQTKQKQKETMSTQFKLEQVSDGIPSFIITSSKQDKRNLFEENVIINRNQFNKNLANGQSGQNLVNGQSGQNLVNGQSGQNLANGQSGQNLVNGQSGQNLVNGQPGQNLVNGQSGQNLVNGQPGQNLVNGQSGQNLANGQSGQNLVNGQPGQNLANGQPGQNLVNGQSGQNLVNGQPGQNLVNGQSGQNLANGQSGQNLVNGQPGQNLANGQPGQNLVNGQSGQNLANGQSGQNLANGQPGQNLVNGQSGQNLAHGQPGQNLANGQPNTDTNYNNNQLFSPGLTLNDLSTNTKENYCPHTQQVIQYLQTLNQQNLSNDVKQLIKQLYSIACQGKCVQTQTELQVLTNQKIMVSQLLTQSQTSLGSSFFTRSSTMSESEYLKNQKRLKGKLGGSTPQVEGNLDSFVLTSAPSIKKNFQRK